MQANQTKDELDKTELRIAELEAERERQTEAFEATQRAFIEGKVDSDRLHAEQSKQTLLSQTIESLRTLYQRLKTSFENQSEVETRRELLKQMKTTAEEVSPLVDRYLETRNELNDILAKYVKTLVERRESYISKQTEYQRIVAELKPTDEEIQAIDQMTRTLAATGHINHPGREYDRAINLAEQTLAGKLSDAARAKRQADFNKLTAGGEAGSWSQLTGGG